MKFATIDGRLRPDKDCVTHPHNNKCERAPINIKAMPDSYDRHLKTPLGTG
jgi:hypothetical protein